MRRNILWIGAILATAGVGCATAPERVALPGAPVHSPKALRADLAIARAALEEGDPGLYRFAGKGAVDQAFERAAAGIRGPLTSLELYRILGPAVASIRNGHTQLSLDATTVDLLAHVPRLPLVVRVLSGRLWILRDFSGGVDTLAGAEILAVNARPIADLLRELQAAHSLDGDVRSSRDMVSGWSFASGLATSLGVTGPFRVTVRRDGAVSDIAIEGRTSEWIQDEWRRAHPADPDIAPRGPSSLRFEGDVAILRVSHWDYPEEGKRSQSDDFRDWMTAVVDAGSKALVIDLRNNGGGEESLATELFSYLVTAPFRHYECAVLKSDRFAFLRYVEEEEPSYAEILPGYTTPASVSCRKFAPLELTNRPNLGIQPPRAPHYGGPVYVLVNGGSFSTSAEFAALIKSHRRGRIVGEETSGAYYGNNSGIMPTITLPASRLNLTVPLIAYYLDVRPDQPRGAGVVPDFAVTYSIEELLAGGDKELELALCLAESAPAQIASCQR